MILTIVVPLARGNFGTGKLLSSLAYHIISTYCLHSLIRYILQVFTFIDPLCWGLSIYSATGSLHHSYIPSKYQFGWDNIPRYIGRAMETNGDSLYGYVTLITIHTAPGPRLYLLDRAAPASLKSFRYESYLKKWRLFDNRLI